MKIKITSSKVLYRNNITMLREAIQSFLSTDMIVKLYLVPNSPTNDLTDFKEFNLGIIQIHNPTNLGLGAA